MDFTKKTTYEFEKPPYDGWTTTKVRAALSELGSYDTVTAIRLEDGRLVVDVSEES